MAVQVDSPRTSPGAIGGGSGVAVQQRRSSAVLLWAAVGVVFLAIEVVAFSGWVISGDATPTPTGPTPVPTYMKIGTHGFEAISIVAFGLMLYFFLIKPWRREGRITTDGLFCLVFPTVIWQDLLGNYFNVWTTYNTEFLNLGHWNPHIVGWLSPRANLFVEPLAFMIPLYCWLCFGMVVVGCWVMRKLQARWPQLSNAGLLGLLFTFFVLFDLVLEPPWLLLGLFQYPGAIKGITLWHGHYYQYPLYEGWIIGIWWTALTALRFFKNDRGETLGERGLSALRVNGKAKMGVRVLALVGAVNVGWLFYSFPAAMIGIYSSPWPADVQQRSYMTGGVCGPGTTYSCPGPGIPIPRTADSLHVSPEGKLIVPAGTELPSPTEQSR